MTCIQSTLIHHKQVYEMWYVMKQCVLDDGGTLVFRPLGLSACPVIGHPLSGLASTIPSLLVKDEKCDLALYFHYALEK